MGLAGAAIGVLLGAGIQLALPTAVRDFLPIGVSIEIVPRAMVIGLVTGLWIALLFALRPLLALRRVSPLQALRRHVETDDATGAARRRPDPAVWMAGVAIAATVLAIAVARAPAPRVGFATAGGIAVVLGILWLAAGALAALARRLPRARWPYVVRQGIANLHRPANQTRSVVLALGFGVFLISALALVQSALLHEFAATTASSRANLLFFDIQDDQLRATDSIIRAGGYQIVEQTPIVTMRIASINGTPVSLASPEPADTDTADSGSAGPTPRRESRRSGAPRRAGWALRREYRSTYRDTLVSSERVVAGRWNGHRDSSSIAPVSFEAEVAKELGVTIGDRITWDVQGVPVESRITSLREVDWARFEPNFFAVFPAGVLEHAPKQYVFLADVPGAAATASLQRSIGERYPNISSVDLSLIRDTVNGILRKITLAIRFLTVFCLLMGIPVLFSAVAATRRERIRESVLLKTLGASRKQVTRIMVAEYAMLGLLASVAGTILSVGGAWLLVHFLFETPFVPDVAPPLLIALASAVLTIVIGVAGSRSAFASTPLEMLRAE
jgi:putative ABC transport system permease protein